MAVEPHHHRIQVTCPECGQVQAEPGLVISTQCRACRANFQVQDGKGVVRKRPITRLAKPRKEGDPEPELSPVHKLLPILRSKGPAPLPAQSLFRRIFNPTKPARPITCFNCQHHYTASGQAQSSQCPKCSGYISLIDYEITDHWNRRIQTCGDVVIHKSGTVAGVTLQCHHLTVLGELAGSVNCSGDLIIRSHGKIIGTVTCQNLRIEKGARVEFLNPVTAANVFIDGQVRGQIYCSGPVVLEKRAQLTGLVRTTSLVIKPGAKHSGSIEMIQKI